MPPIRCTALLLASALALPLAAQEAPAAPDAAGPKPCRELFTTAAAVTDTGVLQLNAGAQEARDKEGGQARRFPSQLALGAASWFDLRVAWSGPTTLKDPGGNSQSGGGDPLFGGQVQALRQDQAGLDLGAAYWHKLPRASVEKGIGTGKADDTLLLTASRTEGPWEFDGNAGANWLGRPDRDGRARQGVLSLAVTWLAAPGWNASLDTVALGGSAMGARTLTSILAVSRDLTPDLTVDLGVEGGWTAQGERWAVDAGLVWKVGRFWGK